MNMKGTWKKSFFYLGQSLIAPKRLMTLIKNFKGFAKQDFA